MSDNKALLDIDELMNLWTVPPDERVDPLADFAELYADPVSVNGQPMALIALVDRARALHTAFSDHHITVVDRLVTSDKVAVAFHHRARHAGPWATSLGVVPATGQEVQGLGIDIFTLRDGRVEQIWVLADELQRIQQVASPRV